MKLISVRGIIYTSLLIFFPKYSHQIIIHKQCKSTDGVSVKINGSDHLVIPLNEVNRTNVEEYFNISDISTNVKTYTRFSLKNRQNPPLVIENITLNDITITPEENEQLKQIWETTKPSYEIQVYSTVNKKRELLHVTLVPSDNTYNISSHSPHLHITYLDDSDECNLNEVETPKTDEEDNEVSTQEPSRPVLITAEQRRKTLPNITEAPPVEHTPPEPEPEVFTAQSQEEYRSKTPEPEESEEEDNTGIVEFAPEDVVEEYPSTVYTIQSYSDSLDQPDYEEPEEPEEPELEEVKPFEQPEEDSLLIKIADSPVMVQPAQPGEYLTSDSSDDVKPKVIKRIDLNLSKVDDWDPHIETIVDRDVETFKTSDKNYIIGTVRCELLTVTPLSNETNRVVILQNFQNYKILTIVATIKDQAHSISFSLLNDGTVKIADNKDDMWTSAIKIYVGTSSRQLEQNTSTDSFFSSEDESVSQYKSHHDFFLPNGELDISNISLLNTMNIVNFGSITCYYVVDSDVRTVKAGKILLQENIFSKQFHACILNNHDKIDVRLAILAKNTPEWTTFYYSLTKKHDSTWTHTVMPTIEAFNHISYSSKYLSASNRFLVLDPPEAPVETDVRAILQFNALNLDQPVPNSRLDVTKKNKSATNLSIKYKSVKDFEVYRIDMIKYKAFEYFFNTPFRVYHIEASLSGSSGHIVCFLTDRLSKAAMVFQPDKYGAYRPILKFDENKKFIFDYPPIAAASHLHNKLPAGPVFNLLTNTSIGNVLLAGLYDFRRLATGYVYLFKNSINSLKLRFGPNEIEMPENYTNLRIVVLNSPLEHEPNTVNFEYILEGECVSFTYQFFEPSDFLYNKILPITSRPSTPTIYNDSDVTDYREVEYKYNPTTNIYGKRAFKNMLGSYITQSEIDLNSHGKLPLNIIDYKNEVKDSTKSGTLTTSSDSAVVGTFVGGNIYVSVKPMETSRRVDYVVRSDGVKEFNIVSVVNWKLIQQKFIETGKNTNVFLPN